MAFSTSGWMERTGIMTPRARFVNLDFRFQARAEAEPLDVEISFHQLQFFRQRHETFFGLKEIAEDAGEVEHGLAGLRERRAG